jgi:hypothetical protein
MIIIIIMAHPNPFFLSHGLFHPHHSSHKVTEQPECAHKPAVYRDPKTPQPSRNSEEERTDKYRHWNIWSGPAIEEEGFMPKDGYTLCPPLPYGHLYLVQCTGHEWYQSIDLTFVYHSAIFLISFKGPCIFKLQTKNLSGSPFKGSIHRSNMELDLQSLFGLLCTDIFLGWNPSTPPPYLGSYTRALLVSQNRRHLFVTPWQYWIPHDPTLFSMDSTFNGCHGLGHLRLISPCSANALTHLMEGHMRPLPWYPGSVGTSILRASFSFNLTFMYTEGTKS